MKRGHLAIGISVAVALVVAFLVVVLAVSPDATDRITSSPLVGKAAPPIDAKTVSGGTFDLESYQGEWVLVNFFATWCQPCRDENPQLREFESEHAKAGDAQIVSVVVDDDVANVKAFFAAEGGSWPAVIDPKSLIALSYGLVKVPESYLVSPDGVIEAKVSGEVTAAGLDSIIAKFSGHS